MKRGQTPRTLEDQEVLASEAEGNRSNEPEKGNKSDSSLKLKTLDSSSSLELRTLDSSQGALPPSSHLKPLFLVISEKIIHITTRAPQVSVTPRSLQIIFPFMVSCESRHLLIRQSELENQISYKSGCDELSSEGKEHNKL